MFFGNSKLEQELTQKEALVKQLRLDMQKIKAKHKEELKSLKSELAKSKNEFKSLKTQHEAYVQKVEAATNIDIMSGAHNKRYFYDIVESMISLSKRNKTAMSVAILYIDEFEKLDESFPQLNEILQTLVHRISGKIRESDVFVRLDKAKFVLVFPQTSLEKAKMVCNKLKRDVETKPVIDELYFSLSVSSVEFLENENINSVLSRAEELL